MDKERVEILKNIGENPDVLRGFHEERTQELEEKRETARIKVEMGRGIIKMRVHWSWGLLLTIIGIVIFDAYFIRSIGLGKLVFVDNLELAHWFFVESLAKIAGLAIIVVKFLFDKDSF